MKQDSFTARYGRGLCNRANWSLKLCSLLLLTSLSARAQLTSIVTGPVKANVGHANVRLLWVANTAAKIRWGYEANNSHVGASSSTAYANHFTSNANHTVMGMYLSGLTANTLYYYRACAWDGTTEVCAPEDSFTTLAAPSPHPAAPTPPAVVDTTLPTCGNGRSHCISGIPVSQTVGSCDGPMTGINAVWATLHWGDTLIIPHTFQCYGHYAFPVSIFGTWDGHSRMSVVTDLVSSLPSGRVAPSNAGLMPTLYESVFPMPDVQSLSGCYAGGKYWDNSSVTPGFYMHYCGVQATATVSSVALNASCGGNTVTCNVFDVVLSSGLSTLPTVNQWGYVTSVGGLLKANGTFQYTSVTDSSHFTITMLNDYRSTAGQSYTSGGTLQSFAWQSVSFTSYSGLAPTGTCTPGTTGTASWAYSNLQPDGITPLSANIAVGEYVGTTYSTERVFACDANGAWMPFYIDTGSNVFKQSQATGASILDASQSQHVRFIGLNIQHRPLYADPLLLRGGPGGGQGWFQGGSAPDEYVMTQAGQSNDLVFDRLLLLRIYPSKGAQIFQIDGDNLALIHSYMKVISNYWGVEDYGSNWDNATGEPISSANGGGPKLLLDDYLEGYGITVHFNDGPVGRGFAGSNHDTTVAQCTFFRDLTTIYKGPGSSGIAYYQPQRQMLEFKSGVYIDINGNTFTGNMRSVSQGAAIALTAEEYGVFNGIHVNLSYSGGNGIFTVLSGEYTVNVGDWMTASSCGCAGALNIYQVTAVNPAASQFTIAGFPTGLSGSINFIENVTGLEGISDVNIRNNTFDDVPTVLDTYSHISHDVGPFRISLDRLAMKNNIFKNIGPGGNGSGPLQDAVGNWQCSGSTGAVVYGIWGGAVDWVYDHNTFYNFNPAGTANPLCGLSGSEGTAFSFISNDFPFIAQNESEGLQITNSMHWTPNAIDPISVYSGSGSTCNGSSGGTMLTCFTNGTLTFLFSNNGSYVTGSSPSANYPTPNFWGNYTGATNPFINPAANNFKLIPGSCCLAGGSNQASDGTDVGVNMAALLSAQGFAVSAGNIASGFSIQAGTAIK